MKRKHVRYIEQIIRILTDNKVPKHVNCFYSRTILFWWRCSKNWYPTKRRGDRNRAPGSSGHHSHSWTGVGAWQRRKRTDEGLGGQPSEQSACRTSEKTQVQIHRPHRKAKHGSLCLQPWCSYLRQEVGRRVPRSSQTSQSADNKETLTQTRGKAEDRPQGLTHTLTHTQTHKCVQT